MLNKLKNTILLYSFEAAKKEKAGSETKTEKKETEEVKEEVKANIFDEFFDKYKNSCI